jgi:hypothetical protein
MGAVDHDASSVSQRPGRIHERMDAGAVHEGHFGKIDGDGPPAWTHRSKADDIPGAVARSISPEKAIAGLPPATPTCIALSPLPSDVRERVIRPFLTVLSVRFLA